MALHVTYEELQNHRRIAAILFILGNKRHKPLLPEVDIGLRDPTLDLTKHEADLALMDRIMEIRQTKEKTDLPNQTSTVLPARYLTMFYCLFHAFTTALNSRMISHYLGLTPQ